MLKLLTVIGARPQFIKAAAISRAIRNHFSDRVREVIVHTGQHYDPGMSQVFFDQLQIPHEDYNLGVGSGAHGVQTAKMIIAIEEVLLKEQPDGIILYGDTNSTLAGSIAASKLRIPIIHIEAGMRSFTKEVPEEINRILCDHVSTLLFTPTPTAATNLYNEGFAKDHQGPCHVDNPKVIPCGDIMYDNSLYFREVALSESTILQQHQLEPGRFVTMTIHRDNNTGDINRLTSIFSALSNIARSAEVRFVVPLHPRTEKIIRNHPGLERQISETGDILIITPASYLDMIALEVNSEMIITDSGGVQKEAYYFEKPCIILQNETPWVELVSEGCAELADADPTRIESAFWHFRHHSTTLKYPPLFGDGKAAEFTVEMILKHFPSQHRKEN